MLWANSCYTYTKSPPDFTPQILSYKMDSSVNDTRITIFVEGNFFRYKMTRIIIDGTIAIPDTNVYFIDANHIRFILPREINYLEMDYFQIETKYIVENRSGKQETVLRSGKCFFI